MHPAISYQEYRRQCDLAAYSSRLNPYALDVRELNLISAWTSDKQRADYLHIRNGILRLWHRNPSIIVTREEAFQYVKHGRENTLVHYAFEWLARNGYINFGCVHIPSPKPYQLVDGPRRKTIIIIGAGVAGLACARQLTGLCAQFRERWNFKKAREPLPKILILEGRDRIGGRVYSHPLASQIDGSLKHSLANTAEMGAQIITGFDSGNPLDAIVRGQLALEHHYLNPDMLLYDSDGSLVEDDVRDKEMDRLFNNVLDFASNHSWKKLIQKATAEKICGQDDLVVKALKVLGINGSNGLNGAHGPHKVPLTLGVMMDSLVQAHQQTNSFTPLDMRLLNWHYANLEYANAANVDQLSLGGWDQDGGNEFEGRHSQVVGGYSQVPRALYEYPETLDVRCGKAISKVSRGHSPSNPRNGSAQIETEDGEVFIADRVVLTAPLGVLQQSSIHIEPALPDWKLGAINRLGFGLLNKVVLVFDHIFWERHRDMFGLLNEPDIKDSLQQKDYSENRGKSYLFWNTVKTSGRPMLVALMAGDAAEAVETTPDQVLIDDVVSKLQRVFKLEDRPTVVEAIVTRWRKDRFAGGSYSYVGPNARPGDYEAMARPVDVLFFAGEATCVTHPATVHGAYLSGLRAASEVLDTLIGPMDGTVQ